MSRQSTTLRSGRHDTIRKDGKSHIDTRAVDPDVMDSLSGMLSEIAIQLYKTGRQKRPTNELDGDIFPLAPHGKTRHQQDIATKPSFKLEGKADTHG